MSFCARYEKGNFLSLDSCHRIKSFLITFISRLPAICLCLIFWNSKRTVVCSVRISSHSSPRCLWRHVPKLSQSFRFGKAPRRVEDFYFEMGNIIFEDKVSGSFYSMSNGSQLEDGPSYGSGGSENLWKGALITKLATAAVKTRWLAWAML